MYLPLSLAARKLPADAVMLVHGWAPEDGAAVQDPKYDPAAHISPSAIQAVFPFVAANRPPGQAAQVETVWPNVVEKYPAAQPVQPKLPDVVENCPPGHVVQTVFAEMLHAEEMYCPAPHDAQPEQAVLPVVVANCPPGQAVQVDVAWL